MKCNATGAAFTVNVAEALALALPLPLQVSVYVKLPVEVGVTEAEPLVCSEPDHVPDATHDVALVLDHVSVVD